MKYALLCGIWYGRDKPSMHTLFKLIVESMNKLYNEGTCNNMNMCTIVFLNLL